MAFPLNSSILHRWLPPALLVGYWLALFTGTHVPPEFPVLPPEGYDKVVHFSAFVGLAGLLALTWRSIWGSLPIWSVVAAWLLIVTYAAFDEISQPWFRRDCDYYDWRADACGAALGLALVYGWALARSAWAHDAKPAAQ
ncbi:MAG TPA: VanZ family protein [Lacipirellulaceae bacterium]|jgi:VanZ family protein